MRQQFVVPRLSNDERTFAVVSAISPPVWTVTRLRDALTEALTEWVRTSSAGRQAWEENHGDFNVGDLGGYLPAKGDLRRILESRGIRGLQVRTFADTASPAHVTWSYDTVLVTD